MAEAMFAKAGRGYDREQVDRFLVDMNRTFTEKENALQDRIRQLESQLAETEHKLALCEQEKAVMQTEYTEALQKKEQECISLQASVGQRMILADERAEQIVNDAKQQAETLLADAERQASDALAQAQSRAEAESERMIDEVRQRCSVIGHAASLFTACVDSMAWELRKTESALMQAAENCKQKVKE